MEQTTIAAISTPHAMGGIGIVRISGPQARIIASRVFSPKSSRKDLMSAAGYTALFGRVHEQGQELDDAIALVFSAPKSYTGEDVVELSCHGGLYLMQRVLRAVIDAGAVPAQAGEFTKRAFLNGKLSLTQAEGVMDLIASQGEQAARAALSARDGALFERINGVKELLIELSGHLSAWIDFPEEDVPELSEQELSQTLSHAVGELDALLSSYDVGQMMKNGVETAIVGRPNVGKSTLMNLLSGREKSIVTDIPGTTRDIVEDSVNIGDVILHLYDTAGIRRTDDPVEQVGVERAKGKIETAQLILALFDSSRELSEEDRELMISMQGRPCIAVINKTDLQSKIDMNDLQKHFPHLVSISAYQKTGLEELTECIHQVLGMMDLDPTSGILANERQRNCAKRALDALKEAQQAHAFGITLDAVGVEVQSALEALMELTGEQASERVVDEVFSKFCVGK